MITEGSITQSLPPEFLQLQLYQKCVIITITITDYNNPVAQPPIENAAVLIVTRL